MTPTQIHRVQESFKQVAPHAELAARMFYDRLFVIAPQVKPLFRGDMAEQGKKLMSTLAVVVNGLTNLEAILPAAKSLAVKHVGYGVQPDHYAPVGEALVWTLQEALGDSLDGEARDAWIEAYTLLSGVMISEAYGRATA